MNGRIGGLMIGFGNIQMAKKDTRCSNELLEAVREFGRRTHNPWQHQTYKQALVKFDFAPELEYEGRKALLERYGCIEVKQLSPHRSLILIEIGKLTRVIDNENSSVLNVDLHDCRNPYLLRDLPNGTLIKYNGTWSTVTPTVTPLNRRKKHSEAHCG